MAQKKQPKEPKTVSINMKIPLQGDCEEFVKAAISLARKIARELHHNLVPTPRRKTGRPTLKEEIIKTCDEIWKKWGGKFPEGARTKARLVKEITDRLGSIDHRTLNKHLDSWADIIPPTDLPAKWAINLMKRHGVPDFEFTWMLVGPIVTLQVEALKAAIQHVPPGHKLGEKLDAQTEQKVLATFEKNIQEKERARRAYSIIQSIQARRKDPAQLSSLKKEGYQQFKKSFSTT